MTDEPRAKFVIATEDLNNARREDLLRNFAEFECGVGSERARRVMSIGMGSEGSITNDGFTMMQLPVSTAGAIFPAAVSV